ncbi:MAG: hypothetical protein HYY06_05135 [Deltaproteobacteria bacterium]|nr:hypothetical protein [Deltaproteobacteria bacterium]
MDPTVGGAVLDLYGGLNEERVAHLVNAGPRSPEGYRNCGKVEVRTDGYAYAQLYTTPNFAGRLALRGQAVGGESFWAVLGGCRGPTEDEVGNDERARWGFLRLRALRSDHVTPRDTVQLGTDGSRSRGSVRVYDANRRMDRAFAKLEIDDQGPVLVMRDGERTVMISPSGIQFGPDKAGAANGDGAADEPAFEGRLQPLPGAQVIPDVNFVADHPEDPRLQIHYNVIEGPEVGVYVRGTARLRDGRAAISLPDHFAAVTSERGLTAQLTARSIESRGVAVTALSREGLEIAELGGGTGEYEVDYLVQGVRRGREDFAVLRTKRAAVSREALAEPRSDDEKDLEIDAGA